MTWSKRAYAHRRCANGNDQRAQRAIASDVQTTALTEHLSKQLFLLGRRFIVRKCVALRSSLGNFFQALLDLGLVRFVFLWQCFCDHLGAVLRDVLGVYYTGQNFLQILLNFLFDIKQKVIVYACQYFVAWDGTGTVIGPRRRRSWPLSFSARSPAYSGGPPDRASRGTASVNPRLTNPIVRAVNPPTSGQSHTLRCTGCARDVYGLCTTHSPCFQSLTAPHTTAHHTAPLTVARTQPHAPPLPPALQTLYKQSGTVRGPHEPTQ